MRYFFKINILFISIICCTANSFAQEWYDIISQGHVNIELVKQSAEKYFDKAGRGKHTGYKQYQRWLNNATINMDKNGFLYTKEHIDSELKKFRANAAKNKKQKTATLKASNTNTDADGNWSPMGPYYAQGDDEGKRLGRLTALAVEPVNQQLLFVGSHGGGLWRSTDAGVSWAPLIDDADNMFVIAVGIDPHNTNHIVYMNDNSVIFESLDQGDTWSQVLNKNQANSNAVTMIKFHPTISNVYFVATGELLKTTDGGATFETVLYEDNRDIFFKPGDPTTMYSVGNDFWKSTDTGETWAKITNGIDVSTNMRMTVTPADPNRVYILQKDENTGLFGRIYKSTDSGSSFEIMADIDKGAPTSYLGNQGWRCLSIMCSDTDPDKLHMGGINHFRSDDAGATLYLTPNSSSISDVAHIHADILIMSNVNGTLYAATDGGIFRSTDAGATYTALTGGLSTLTGGLTITQFYRIGGTSPFPGTGEGLDPDMIVGGAQDNGTQISKGIDHDWKQWLGSDGMECFIDYTNENNIYGSKQRGTLMYSKNGGATFSVLNTPEGDDDGAWTTPFEMDPITPTTLYVGFEDLYRSTNSGDSWEALTTGQTEGSYISEIAIAPSDNNYMYFAEGSSLWVSTNAQSANRTWTEIVDVDENVNYISFDPNDPLHALVACTGSLLYETKDAGVTWNEISGNLPDIAIESVLMDNSEGNTIYAGTLKGVYYKDDTMTDWEVFGNGLPRCQIRELEIHYHSKKLRVATYGRGVWEIPIFSSGETPVVYCDSQGDSVVDEWIDRVQFGSIDNISGVNGGYADFQATHSTTLAPGASETITITPAWSSTVYSEGYAVWIDFNNDGDFSDAGEQVYTQAATSNASVSGIITIPASTSSINTTMRVSMEYNAVPEPCGSLDYGEVEDYSIVIGGALNIDPIANANGPYSGTENQAINFSSDGSSDSDGSIVSYSWNFGNGDSSTQENPSYTYTSDGSYIVTLTVTDNDGGTDSESVSVTVDPENTGGNYATLPYSTGFETGLDSYWNTATENAYGRVLVTTDNTPHTGSQHLTMDVNTGGNYSTNEATLNLNLVGKNQVDMSFWWKEFGDETHTEDGVFFSDNGGSSFTKVYDFTGASTTNNTWQEIVLDIDALAAANGLSLTATFVVKFQQYDNYNITTDGFAFDDINVMSTENTAMPTGYCPSNGANSSYEWIDLVQLGSIYNVSGNDAGYKDYTALSTDLSAGTQYTISFSTGFSNSSYTEFWYIWIDYNRDGDFTDTGELVATGSSSLATTLTVDFTVPAGVSIGNTRMRVKMTDGASTDSCETDFNYGEVEDYAVNLSTNPVVQTSTFAKTIYSDSKKLGHEKSSYIIYPNPIEDYLNFNLDYSEGLSITITAVNGQVIKQEVLYNNRIDVTELSSGAYFLRIDDGQKEKTYKFIKQ